jgi:hypothetical protein
LHFGTPGGERYETLQRCWILLSFSGVAVVFLGSARLHHLRQPLIASNWGPVLLIAGVLMPWHVTPLLRQYSVYGKVAGSIDQNFQSGFQPDSRQMSFISPPNRGVITPATIAPGTYTRTATDSGYDYAGYVLDYFGKDMLTVRPPEGTDDRPPFGTTASPVP